MYIFPYKSIRKQIWPWRKKKVKVNPRSSFEQTLLGPCPQCCIPSPKVIDPLVLEKKIFKRFLTYMGVAAILVMWPRPPEQTFVPPIHGGSTWNLALTGPVVLEKKMFENGGRRQRTEPAYTISSPKGSGELKTAAYSWHKHKLKT